MQLRSWSCPTAAAFLVTLLSFSDTRRAPTSQILLQADNLLSTLISSALRPAFFNLVAVDSHNQQSPSMESS